MNSLTVKEASVLLSTSGAHLEKAASAIEGLRTKLAEADRFRHSTKIASSMSLDQRGGLGEVEYAEKLASSQEDLTVLERALSLHPDANLSKVAHIGEETGGVVSHDGHTKSASAVALEEWLLDDSGQGGFLF